MRGSLIVVLSIAFVGASYFAWTDHVRLSHRLEQVEQRQQAASASEFPSDPRPTPIPVAVLASPVAQAPSAPVSPSPAASANEGTETATVDAVDPGPSKEQFSATLEDFFGKLSTTAPGAAATRSQLVEAMGKLQLGSATPPALDCRGAWCRADFDKLDESQGRELLRQIQTIGWNGPLTAFMIDDDRGGKSLRMYTAQPGAQLPMPM
jgi:hypothetical protein